MNRISTKIVLLIVCLFSIIRIHAQNVPCDFDIECMDIDTNLVINLTMPSSLCEGDQFCVSFDVENFEYILSLQFDIQYDPAVIQFDNNPGDIIAGNCLSQQNFDAMLFNATSGNIRLLWVDLIAEGNCCLDGSNLFEICFTVIGDPLDPVYVNINNIEEVGYGLDFSSPFTCYALDNATVNVGNGGVPTTVCCDELTVVAGHCNTQDNADTGSLNFQFCGGVAPYIYDVIGASTGLVDAAGGILDGQELFVDNLPVDFYTITVTDAAGNTDSQIILIDIGDALSVALDGRPPSCFDRENGHVEIDFMNSVGVDANTNIAWSVNEFGIDRIDDLATGIYTVTVTDGTGCSATADFDLALDTLKIFYEVIDSAGCIGGNNGVVKLTATGGYPVNGNEYEFQGNGTFSDCHIISNVEGGSTLEIEVEDNSWAVCRVEESFVMPSLAGIDAIGINLPSGFTSTNDSYEGFVDCSGDVLSLVEILIGNSTAFTQVLMDQFGNIITDNSIQLSTSGNVINIQNLPPGQYLLQINATDPPELAGCIRQYPINIISPPEFELTGDFVAPDCAGNLGSISYMSTGGTGNHLYTVNGNSNTDNPITNLNGGVYEIIAIDENQCRDTITFNLPFAGNLAIEIDTLQLIDCDSGPVGALFCNIISPCDNCTIEWKDDMGNTISFGDQLINLGPGCYTACVTDNVLNCDATATACLDGVDIITYDINLDPPNCFGGCDGTVGLIITQGQAPITFEWEDFPGLNGSVIGPVCAGSYPVVITDNTGCMVMDTVVLENPPSLEITIKDIVNPPCFGEAMGSIFVEAANGFMGNDFYDYLVYDADGNEYTTGAGQGCIEITGLLTGEYTIIVSDGQCALETPLSFTVGAPDPIEVNLDNSILQLPSCFGFCDGGITVEAMGGTGPYTYNWVANGTVSPQITDLCGGEYHYLFIEDALGCTVLDSIFLTQPDTLIASLNPFESLGLNCFDATDGVISITQSGGTPNFMYEWNNNISNTNSAINLGQGFYSVTVTDANGCTDIYEQELTAPDPIIADIPTPATPNCFGEQTCITVQNVSGGAGTNYSFSINNGLLFPIDSCVNVIADEYTISVFDGSGASCSFDTTIVINQPDQISVDLGADFMEVALGDSTVLLQANINSINPVTIQWFPTDGVMCNDPLCQTVSIAPTSAQLYEVIITDSNGCTAEDEIQITIDENRNVYFPTAFSPNGDGFNDKYSLFLGDGVENVLYFGIYDRWGNLMFEVDDVSPDSINSLGWDGLFKGKEVNPGVYVYQAQLMYIDGQQINYKGSFSLIK